MTALRPALSSRASGLLIGKGISMGFCRDYRGYFRGYIGVI